VAGRNSQQRAHRDRAESLSGIRSARLVAAPAGPSQTARAHRGFATLRHHAQNSASLHARTGASLSAERISVAS
jgi:hypothetical protein